MIDYKNKKQTPFSPGNIVSTDLFVGRENLIKNILKYAPNIVKGNNRHFYLVGKRGMGKSSFSSYLNYVLTKRFNFVVVQVSSEGVNDLDSLIYEILKSLVETIESKTWANKIIDAFDDNVQPAGFMDLKLKFKPKQKDYVTSIKRNFPRFIKEVSNNLENKDALFIILDDINGLCNTPEFANWYKNFVNTMDMNYHDEIPVGFLLTSYPKNLDKLRGYNESAVRIFYHLDIEPLQYNEIKKFYQLAFEKAKITYDVDALELMIEYSYGIPLMMQEIGEQLFWLCDENKHITSKMVLESFKMTSNNILVKYLNNMVSNEIYENILKKISDKIIINEKDYFTIGEVEKTLNHEEQQVFKSFILEAKKLGVLDTIDTYNEDKYEFTNQLYSIYLKFKNFNIFH